MVLYTELFYAIIPACFHTFCCSVIPTSPYIFNGFFYIIIQSIESYRFTAGCYRNAQRSSIGFASPIHDLWTLQ